MDIEIRRQHKSTGHLPPAPLSVAKMPKSAAVQAAQDGQQRGYKSEEERGEQKRKSSVRLSGLLPDPSPGHQMHPAIEPGPLYGVRRPKFTYRHALYDVPFYGIENLEISSSRYEVLTQSNSPKELEMLNDPLRDTRTSGDSGRSSGAGVGVGVGGEGGGDGLLREHREHIWSVAHEEEYGSSEATAAAEGVEENGLHRGRHKRTQRILPIAHLPPPAATESTSGSGSGSVEIQRHYSKDKNRAETTTARGRGRREPGMRIEVDHGSHFELTNMETISSVGALSTTTRNSNGVLFLTSDRGRHGHGHGHGYGHRRSSRPPRPPRPVSQGVYGPDSFQESLDKLKNTPERPTGPIPKLLGIVRRHWKTWLCVGTLLAVAIVAPLMLKRKGVSGGDKGIASAGQGGGDEGDDIFYDGDTTSAEEPTNGVGRKVVTKSATPSASSTRNVKESPIKEEDKGGIRQAVQDGCWVHPITLNELRVPALGLVAVQHPSLFDGATTYQPCLPLESIPQGSIRLSRWTVGHVPDGVERVRVEGVNVDEPLAKVAKLVVVPIAVESDVAVDNLAGWIRPTSATNTDLISQGKRGRQWISRLLEQTLRNQISTGSVFPAKIKGQQRFFRVKEVQFIQEAEEIHASRSVMLKESTVEIGQQESPTCTNKGQAVPGGMDDLIKEICHFIGENILEVHVSAFSTACCQKMKLREFPLSLARALSNTEIMESDQAVALSYVRTVFDMALQSAPSAVVLQDLDTIAKDQGVDSQLQSTAVSILTKEIERARLGKDVFVFAVTRNRSKLPDIFTRLELFQHEFQIPIPVKAQRQCILESLIEGVEGKSTGASNISELAHRVAQMTSGYVAKDLRNLYRSALLHSLREDRRPKTDNEQQVQDQLRSAEWDDFAYAIETSKPSQQIEFESFSSQRPLGVFGGYRDLKRRVHQTINWPVTNPETFKRIGVRPPMGLLLYGPSGCGKTMLVQTLATESNMNFIPIKGPEIFSKYLGETEATLRRLFAMARQIAPCILFFDEMDSIGAKRGWGGDGDGAGTNGVNERVLSTLLNEMDGIEERTGVFVIGCTNQPRAIDDALLRPGRLDQLVYVGYPSLVDREEIIATIGERIPLPRDQESRQVLAKKTVGFSPADLDALFREAAILSLRRSIDADSVTMDDIEVVIKKMSNSVQERIDKRTPEERDSVESDVLVPSLYREFQQER
ncbi:hypothetical protein BGW39_000579 [Mortierella sp. 14UC]|nr:hypothetical protein BGW39_000579 [Mortierella sp. 14UC]